ncbi:ABC transporter substrate-binding protein [Halotalea alkalilenta]|uniref:ABC transporter substrate-binding protein n=1 Tax=Halotalea alkalilenta TaxID=376489 RepID=A0A172YBE4_9GAMM|nr:ABC transporter substrate-binding protein [Halotalea alkalilenta]ANF56544.1 ABC transporter substrate-binding protein [Halotalea alkalilenta]
MHKPLLNALLGISLSFATLCAAQADTPLRLYTSQPNADAQATVDAFQRAHPEIRVEWVRDGTSQLLTRLRAEREAGVPAPDVLLISDALSMQGLAAEGWLESYDAPGKERFDPAFYDPEGRFYGTKLITTGIAYHQRAERRPQRWRDLAEPELAGLLSMPSPLYSGAAMIHLESLLAAPGLGWDYYTQLREHGAQAQGGNGGVLTAVASGAKPYGMLVDFMALRERAKGAPIEFVFPAEGVSYVTEPVAITRDAKASEAARRFVDFLLSEPGQELVRAQGYVPAMSAMPTPEGFPPRESIRYLEFDPVEALGRLDADKARFADLFAGY